MPLLRMLCVGLFVMLCCGCEFDALIGPMDSGGDVSPDADVAMLDLPAPDVVASDLPAADVASDVPRLDAALDVPPDAASDVPWPDVPRLDVAPDAVSDVPRPDIAPDLAAPDLPAPDVAPPDAPAPDVPSPDVTAPDVPAPDATAPDVTAPDATFSVMGSSCTVQTFAVPATATYRIVALGGGVSAAGLGARVQGDFLLVAGTELRIAVGAAGFPGYACCSGPCGLYAGFGGTGGGGSFVMRGTTPLLIAGGGSAGDAYADHPTGVALNSFAAGGKCMAAPPGGSCLCGPGNPRGCSSLPPTSGGTGYTDGTYNQGGSSFNAGANPVNTARVNESHGSVSITRITRP